MSFTRTAVIRAPPERVFSVLADLGQTKQWMPSVHSIDDITPGPFRVGTGWKETRKAGKRTMESTIQVALYRPPSQLGLQVDGKAMKGQMTSRSPRRSAERRSAMKRRCRERACSGS